MSGKVCVVCGKANSNRLCADCKKGLDVEDLCNRIIAYKPQREDNPDVNPLWEKISLEYDSPYGFREVVMDLAKMLPFPRREYQMIHSMSGDFVNVAKDNRAEFVKVYAQCVDYDGLTRAENNRLKGLMLNMLYMEYRYYEADEMASELIQETDLMWQTVYVLADFYVKTRRYDEADLLLAEAEGQAGGDEYILKQYAKIKSDCDRYRAKSEAGKEEYMPKPKEYSLRDEAVDKYVEFINHIGIDLRKPSPVPSPIAIDAYPAPVFINKGGFDSFVAYDFETTGLYPAYDCIIEVGAVRVVNGEIDGEVFMEYVKPFKKSISEKITQLTGIKPTDVKNARPMWEVIPDFMEFVGDDILVGYNSQEFDSKFLVRAGRYSNLIIRNKQFDLYKYLGRVHGKGIGNSNNLRLGTVSKYYGIENPAAHRAWADALTTAKVYLKAFKLD